MKLKQRVKNAINGFRGHMPLVEVGTTDVALGEEGRESRIEPLTRDFGNAIIRPQDVRQNAGFKLTYKNLVGLSISEAVRVLVRLSPEMRSATRIYSNFLIQDMELDSDDENAKAIINEFIKGMGGKAKFLSVLRQGAYGMYVEGGSCFELSNDMQRMAKKIDWVSPWSLAAQKMESDEGEYWVYGQQSLYGRLDPILYDESDPNPYFKYIPMDQQGNEPFGQGALSPIVSSVTALNEMIAMMVSFLQGRVFPKHIYQIDVQTLAQAGYTSEQITKAAKATKDLLDGKLNVADITQDITITAPIIATLVGAMERAGLDGTEMMADIFERQSQRGSGIPRTLFGSRRTGTGLNDNESRIEWGAWDISIDSDQVLITDPITEFFSVILMQQNNHSEVKLKLVNKDVEINRIHAEYFDMKVDAFVKLKQLMLYTQEELRRKFNDSTKSSFDFSDMEPDLPPELMNAEPEPQPMPSGDE